MTRKLPPRSVTDLPQGISFDARQRAFDVGRRSTGYGRWYKNTYGVLVRIFVSLWSAIVHYQMQIHRRPGQNATHSGADSWLETSTTVGLRHNTIRVLGTDW